MDVQRATLESMGLQSKKAVAIHILQENVYESNLVPDIANVDYLAGHQGRMNLQPLAGLQVFVDDVYVYGPLQEKDLVRVPGRRTSCTTGEEGAAKRVVAQISIFVREVWGEEDGYKNVSIAHTVDANSSGTIVSTVGQIECETGYRARRIWKSLHPGEEPAAYFVAKVDVSNVPMERLQEGLPHMRRLLEAIGWGQYQIDYTQDFSGTLDRPALVQHLENEHNFFQQGEMAPPDNAGCILDNTSSVGNHVCTLVQTRNGRTTSTKLYNKFVSQIEAGDVRGTFGGHMVGTVDSTNHHLQRTLFHPAVLARGCTRIEVSLYGCGAEDLSTTVAEELVAEVLELVSPTCQHDNECQPQRDNAAYQGLFVVQPTAKQWENYASHLDRNFFLGDRPQGAIYLAWSGHSKTGRVQGMLVRPTPAMVANDANWERAVQWAMADFGFQNCPIFRTEILGEENDEVVFSPLRCYTKVGPTILAASNKPTELHLDAPNPQDFLPPTPTVEWVWRTRKPKRIGMEPPSRELVEVPEIAAGRHLSTLSTRNRYIRLEELVDARDRLDWAERMERIVERARENTENRYRELERLEEATKEILARQKERNNTRNAVFEGLLGKTYKISEHAGKTFNLLGYRTTATGKKRVVLEEVEHSGYAVCVWPTKGLERILDNQSECFEKEEEYRDTTIHWIPRKPSGLQFRVQDPKTFWNNEGTKISWNPLDVLSTPNMQDLQRELLAQREALAGEMGLEDRTILGPCRRPPRPKDSKKALEMPPGDYAVAGYAETTCRNAPRTILFAIPLDENGQPTTPVDTPIWGPFLQEELAKIAPLATLVGKQLYCRLGHEKTTKSKHKCRIAQLFVPQDPDKF